MIGVDNGACGASGSGANYAGSGCGAPNEVLGFTGLSISEIIVTGGAGNNFTIDDVNFQGSINAGSPGSATPEPESLTLVMTGLGGVVALARRKRLFQK